MINKHELLASFKKMFRDDLQTFEVTTRENLGELTFEHQTELVEEIESLCKETRKILEDEFGQSSEPQHDKVTEVICFWDINGRRIALFPDHCEHSSTVVLQNIPTNTLKVTTIWGE